MFANQVAFAVLASDIGEGIGLGFGLFGVIVTLLVVFLVVNSGESFTDSQEIPPSDELSWVPTLWSSHCDEHGRHYTVTLVEETPHFVYIRKSWHSGGEMTDKHRRDGEIAYHNVYDE